MTLEETRQLWAKVKENFAKLDACEKHVLEPLPEEAAKKFPMRFAKRWYEQGFAHGANGK